jgi:DNA-directed RNA polymerase specialized sigma24 family protein
MLTDEQLVQAMAAGDQAAFETFVYRYHEPLLGYLERQLQDPAIAEELVQEIFIRLIRQLKINNVPCLL